MSDTQPSGPSHTQNSDGPLLEGPLHTCRGSEIVVEDESVPIPPRYWWLKRILTASGALLVLLVALRLWWGWIAERRLQAEIDRIVAAGEPIYPEDFDPKEQIPDEENAAKYLLQAETAINFTLAQTELFERVSDAITLNDEDREEVRKLLEDNADAFRLIRRAREFQGIDWGDRFRSPAYAAVPGFYGGQRKLSKLLRIAARYDFAVGNRAEAVERLTDILWQGRCLHEHPMLLSQLVSWAVDNCAVEGIEGSVLLPSDAGSPRRHVVPSPGNESQVGKLIQQLWDDKSARAGMHRAMQAERMMQLDIVCEMERGQLLMSTMFGWQGGTQASIPDWIWGLFLSPAIKLDMGRLLVDTGRRIRAIASQRMHDAVVTDFDNESVSSVDFVVHPFSTDFSRSLDRAAEIYRRSLTMRKLAAAGLAVRLYRQRHGSLPATLQLLVPDYLPSVPLDPMALDGRAFGYLPESNPPIVYSLGEDGIDDGGQYADTDGTVKYWKLDTPFFINGDRPTGKTQPQAPPASSVRTGEDDDQSGAQGEQDEQQESKDEPKKGNE